MDDAELVVTEPRELVGRLVRQVWTEWAREQPDPKPSWLLSWEELDDGQREVDMRIGAMLFSKGRRAGIEYVISAISGFHEAQPARVSAGPPVMVCPRCSQADGVLVQAPCPEMKAAEAVLKWSVSGG